MKPSNDASTMSGNEPPAASPQPFLDLAANRLPSKGIVEWLEAVNEAKGRMDSDPAFEAEVRKQVH